MFASPFYDPSTGHHYNHLFGQSNPSRGYASASYYGDVDARYNWWGAASGPDPAQTSVDGSSAFSYCPFLTSSSNPSSVSTCGSSTVQGSGAGDSAQKLGGTPLPGAVASGAGPLGLARAAVIEGDAPGALGHVRGVLDDESAGPALRRRALGSLARLGGRGGDPAARALLQSRANGPDRPWALRALAVAEAGRDRPDRALALTAALVAEGGEHAAAGRIVEALASADLGRPGAAMAAVAEAERLAPGDPDVAMARREVALRFPGTPSRGEARGADVAAGVHESTEEASRAARSDVAALGAPRPNPTRGATTVPLVLGSDAGVRVEVFDVLGRSVTVVHDGPLEPGHHALSLPDGAVGPGTYLVRAVVHTPGGASVLTRRLTVVR